MSYTELKTINGASIKGSGNLVVSGGGVSDGDYGDITVSSSGTVWNIDAATVGVTELSATGTPSATTFLRGDNTWAIPTSADPAGWTTIVKSANQDVTNSATFVTDTDLQFSVVAGGHYMVELDLCCSANNTTGLYKFSFFVSSGTMIGGGFSSQYSTANQIINSSSNQSSVINITTPFANIDGLIAVSGRFNFIASANATFSFRFANTVAGAARTSRTWKGSILKYKRID